MGNPFLDSSREGKSDYLTPLCSINKFKVAKLPVYNIDDEIEGLIVKEFFGVSVITNEIKKYLEKLNLQNIDSANEKNLPRLVAEKSQDLNDPEGAAVARDIMVRFGNRLGLMLLALKLGEPENRKARPEWSDEHWQYWADVKDIILVGGLASGISGKILKQQVEYVFSLKGVEPYNILLYDNSSQVAVLGCASCIKEQNGVFVVMDFGQTNIKRCYISKCDGEVSEIHSLTSWPSQNMEWEIKNNDEKLRQAKELHSYLVSSIEHAYNEAKQQTNIEPGCEIIISIANYAVDGVLNNNRSGYAKLCMLGDNYADCLNYELSGRLRKDISVKLIHDGTAVALNFRNRKDTVCLSVGSFFGVGFPETKIV